MSFTAGDGSDGDDFNAVFVYDSALYPFYMGEMYHQFHSNYFGDSYPDWYLALNAAYETRGLIESTGCPESTHWLLRR